MELQHLITRFTGDTSNLDASFKSVEARTQNHVSKINRTLGGIRSISNFAAGAAGGIAASLGINAVGSIQEASAAIIQYSGNLEQTRIAFVNLMHSEEEAFAHLKELKKFANETPFQFQELTQVSRRFIAMGFNAKQVKPLLEDIGDAVSAIGGNSEVLDRVALAISQINAKGRVMGQEMNQLAEAGIPAWEILSRAIGKSRAETMKLAEEGRISAQIFLKAFHDFTRENFGGAMEKQSRTFLGAISTIQDALLQTSSTSFEPLFNRISDITVKLADVLKDSSSLSEAANRLGAETGKSFGDSFFAEFEDGFTNYTPVAAEEDVTAFVSKFTDPIGLALENFFQEIGYSIWDAVGLDRASPLQGFSLDKLVPDLDLSQLESFKYDIKQMADETQRLESVKDIFSDLGNKLNNFGDKSETAKVKQQLLAKGIDDMSDSLARQALALASEIDKLGDWKKMLDVLDSLISRTASFITVTNEAATTEALLKAGISKDDPFAQRILQMSRWADRFKENQQLGDDAAAMGKEIVSYFTSLTDSVYSIIDPSKFNAFERMIEQMQTKAATQGIDFSKIVPPEELTKMRNLLKTADADLLAFEQRREEAEKKNSLKAYFDSGLSALYEFNNAASSELAGISKWVVDAQNKLRDVFKGKANEKVVVAIAQSFEKGDAEQFDKLIKNLSDSLADSFGVIQDGSQETANKMATLDAALRSFFSNSYTKSAEEGKKAFESLFSQISKERLQDTLDMGQAHIELMKAQGVNENKIVLEQLKLDREAENIRHNQAVESINKLKDELKEKTLSKEQYEQITKEINARLESEEARHQMVLQQIAQNEYAQTFSGKLEEFRNSIPEIGDTLEDTFFQSLDAISTSLGQNLTNWRAGFKGMMQGIGQDFASLMRDMAAALLRVLMLQLLMKAIGGLTGAFGGGGGIGTNLAAPATGQLFPGVSGIPGLAEGGRPPVGQWVRVGEEGEELVKFDSPATVYSHDDSLNILNSITSGYKQNKEALADLMTGNSYSYSPQSMMNSGNTSHVTNYNQTVNINATMPPSQRSGGGMAGPSERQSLNRFTAAIATAIPKQRA